VGAPRLRPVDSSVIAAVGYDDAQRTLYVRFNASGMYVFHDVPPAAYDALIHAESKGRFFNAEIRDTYRYTRLDTG
jgi:KTSC domain